MEHKLYSPPSLPSQGRCKRVTYCNKECQRTHWSAEHKRHCPMYVAFQKWQLEDGKDVSHLPRQGELVWFDDGSEGPEHWVHISTATQMTGMPRLHGKIVWPATAISILTTGSDADAK